MHLQKTESILMASIKRNIKFSEVAGRWIDEKNEKNPRYKEFIDSIIWQLERCNREDLGDVVGLPIVMFIKAFKSHSTSDIPVLYVLSYMTDNTTLHIVKISEEDNIY